jgi:hypothetical protein
VGIFLNFSNFFILIWEFSWSKTKNLNTVVETKMSHRVGLKFSKCLNQTSLICIFKAFGVILLHFKATLYSIQPFQG